MLRTPPQGFEPKITQISPAIGHRNNWEMIAVDNFDSIDNFEIYIVKTEGATVATAWNVANNQISSVAQAADNIVAWYKGVKLTDGRVRVIYENTAASGTHYIGLAFRRQDRLNFMAAILWDGNPGKIDLWKVVNGELTRISTVNLTTIDVINTDAVPKSLEVEVIGNTAKIYVNNKLMITSTDASIADNMRGECGILTYKSKASTFSTFSIYNKRFDIISPNVKSLLCIGSSVTLGSGATTPYPTRLQSKLQSGFCVYPLSLRNAGYSGKNTAYMLSNLPTELSTYNPDIVIIEGNLNDTSLTVGLPIATTLKNLRQMIKLCKQAGAIPILTTSSPLDPSISSGIWNKTCWDLQHQNNMKFRQLAYEENIRLADVAKAFNNDYATYVQADKIHPNDAGAELIAQTIYNTMVSNL